MEKKKTLIKPVLAGAGFAGLYHALRMVARRKAEEKNIDRDNPYIDVNKDIDRDNPYIDVNKDIDRDNPYIDVNKDTNIGRNICEKTGLQDKKAYIRQGANLSNMCGQVMQAKNKRKRQGFGYEGAVKPALDQALSFAGLIILAPLFAIISAAVFLDDPGPVFFVQKRVGKDGHFFWLHKYRTMRLSAPHDIPTHQLENPQRYITKVGRMLRKTSLDEFPQLWDIFRGKMSIIGPRPALWNQTELVAERKKYGADSVLPGLTGWAQINGRDKLEIVEKAKLDGEYARHLRQGGLEALLFDARCFFGTVVSVLKKDGVVEGGTGHLYKAGGRRQNAGIGQRYRSDVGYKASILVVCQYYYPENFQVTPICEALAQDGYAVTVLTGLPNYPAGAVPDAYRHGHRDEYINGVHVIRHYEAGRKKGALRLALNYATYTAAAMRKAKKLEGKYDLVFCYQLSPVLMGLPARKYAKKNGLPFLLYCCDIWPESVKMYVKKEGSLVFQAAKAVSRIVYRSADRIVVQSTSFIDYLGGTHGIAREKMTYIPAFADGAYLTSDFTPKGDTVDFVFLGNLGIAQDLFSVLAAVNQIKDVAGFKVHFVGDGVCKKGMKAYVREKGLGGIVRFYGRRPVGEMGRFYKMADACLISLKADNATGYTLPAKLAGYMAAGKPVVAMMDGSAKDVIEASGCGVCVRAGHIKALAKAMRSFIEEPGRFAECGEKGREYFKGHFQKGDCIRKLEALIDEMVKGQR